MTEASAYVIEEIQETLESVYNNLVSYSRKSKRAISAKKDLENYENGLKKVLRSFENAVLEYSEDEELIKFADRFSSFFSNRHNEKTQQQKEHIDTFLTDLKSLVHWRKMETSYGKTLGFSDFRSLRGDSRKR